MGGSFEFHLQMLLCSGNNCGDGDTSKNLS